MGVVLALGASRVSGSGSRRSQDQRAPVGFRESQEMHGRTPGSKLQAPGSRPSFRRPQSPPSPVKESDQTSRLPPIHHDAGSADPAGHGDARKATTFPTSSARPKRPNGSSRRTNSAMPSGSACWRFHQEPPGNENRARGDAVDADVVARELLGHRFGQADLRGLHGVVGHPAARLAAVDRRDHQDHAAPPRPHRGHGQPRRPDGRIQRLVERLLPLVVAGLD